ncbi:MAG: AEC family transporter [Methylobacteriaceae bacterium]|nr:AEC family transporter [Methylobacteriaceae bacterium]
MQAVLNAALPIFALILTGFLCARFGGFDRSATDNLNRFAVYLALPALMFLAMSKITPDQVRQFGFALTFAGGIAVTFAIGFGLSRVRGRAVANSSIEGLDAGYSNVGFMGIPLCLLVFGQASVPAAIIATLFTACVLFLFAVVLIEIDLHKGASLIRTVGKVSLSLVRNPLLIAPIAGLLVGLSGIMLPGPLTSFASLLGGAASPCALVCIGLFLAQERVVSGDAASIGALVVLKLLVQPAVTALFAFYVFDVPSLWARSAVLLSALPIGSGPFTIAKLYGLEAGVTSGAILISHVFSVLTVSLLVAWLA